MNGGQWRYTPQNPLFSGYNFLSSNLNVVFERRCKEITHCWVLDFLESLICFKKSFKMSITLYVHQQNASVLWVTTTQPVRNRKDISIRSFNFRPITHVELAKPTIRSEISQRQSGERDKFSRLAPQTPIHFALMAVAPSGTLVELQPKFGTIGLNREWEGSPQTGSGCSNYQFSQLNY